MQVSRRWIRAILAAAAVLAPMISSGEEPPAKKGWRLFLEAREAAGAGPSGEPLLDYAFELETKTQHQGQTVKIQSEVFFLHPHYVRQVIQTPNGELLMIYDGERAYQLLSDDIQPLPPDSVRQFEADLARSHILLGPPPPQESVRFVGREQVEGRPVDVIEIDDVAGTPLRLYLDAETRDVVKKSFTGETPAGTARVEEFYSDFQEIDGYRWHHHKRVFRDGELALEAATSNLRINTGLRKSDIIH